jgi:hypothetical protein
MGVTHALANVATEPIATKKADAFASAFWVLVKLCEELSYIRNLKQLEQPSRSHNRRLQSRHIRRRKR